MKTIVPAILLILLIIPNQAFPALTNHGTYSYDDATGLNWLHLTETAGLTISEVNTLIGPGGSLYGWRYATGSEFETMAAALCANPASCSSADFQGYSSDTNGVVSTILAQFGDIGTSGDMMAYGILADGPPPYAQPHIRWAAVLSDNPFYAESITKDYIVTHNSWVNPDWNQSASEGSLLVQAQVVPIPGAVWLLGSGLIGLIGLRRKLKK